MSVPALSNLPRPVLLLAAITFLLPLLATAFGPYGLFIDEFYYVACSARLDFGYVDHPPLFPLLLRGSRALLGDSAVALRVLPALAGALTVFLTALAARRLGAGAWGQTLAALCVAAAPGLVAFFGFSSMNALEVPIWLGLLALLAEIGRRADPRLWLAFGALAGLGLQNKHTLVLLLLAVGVGLVLTPARRHLATRWPWLAALLALAILLPNLLWQAAHGWPSLEFYRNASLYKNLPAAPHQILIGQALFAGLGALPVWLAGLVLLFRRRSRGLGHLGFTYVILLALIVASRQSRPDRLAGLYPLVFAAGAVLLEEASARDRWRWLRWALPSAILALAVPALPLVAPLLPPAKLAAYAAAVGGPPQIERGEGKASALPQLLADRLGWEQLVDETAAAAALLTPAERAGAVVFAPSYGHAGAIELLGRGRGLPPVYSTHNSYYLWGPPKAEPQAAIVLGNDAGRLREMFEEVELAGIHDCELCMPWRDQLPIWIARRPKVRIRDAWPSLKHFE